MPCRLPSGSKGDHPRDGRKDRSNMTIATKIRSSSRNYDRLWVSPERPRSSNWPSPVDSGPRSWKSSRAGPPFPTPNSSRSRDRRPGLERFTVPTVAGVARASGPIGSTWQASTPRPGRAASTTFKRCVDWLEDAGGSLSGRPSGRASPDPTDLESRRDALIRGPIPPGGPRRRGPA